MICVRHVACVLLSLYEMAFKMCITVFSVKLGLGGNQGNQYELLTTRALSLIVFAARLDTNIIDESHLKPGCNRREN